MDKFKPRPPPRTPKQKASVASCVISVARAANTIGKAAVNLQGSLATCKPKETKDKFGHLIDDVCVLNTVLVAADMVTLGSTLAAAASSCAETLNVGALCASSQLSLVNLLAKVAVGSAIVGPACDKDLQRLIPTHTSAADVGDLLKNEELIGILKHQFSNLEMSRPPTPIPKTPPAGAAKETPAADAEAPARRLFLGGGKEAMAANCGFDIIGASLALSRMSLALNSATHVGGQTRRIGNFTFSTGRCPAPRKPKGIGPTAHLEKEAWKISQEGCISDISQVIFFLFSASTYLTLIPVHCLNELNLSALCTEGILIFLTAMAGVPVLATGMDTACVKIPELERQKEALVAIARLGGQAAKGINGTLSAIRHINATLGRLNSELSGLLNTTGLSGSDVGDDQASRPGKRRPHGGAEDIPEAEIALGRRLKEEPAFEAQGSPAPAES